MCFIRIFNILEVIAKTSFSRIAKSSTLNCNVKSWDKKLSQEKVQLIKTGKCDTLINGGLRVGHITGVKFDAKSRAGAKRLLSYMLKNIINDENSYTTLGIDAKRDKWLTKSNLVYVSDHSTFLVFVPTIRVTKSWKCSVIKTVIFWADLFHKVS